MSKVCVDLLIQATTHCRTRLFKHDAKQFNLRKTGTQCEGSCLYSIFVHFMTAQLLNRRINSAASINVFTDECLSKTYLDLC